MWTPPPHGPGSLNKWKGESEPSTSVQLSASWQLIHVSRSIELLLAQSSPTTDCIPLNHEPEQTLHFLKWFVRDFCHTSEGRLLTHCLGTQFMSFQTKFPIWFIAHSTPWNNRIQSCHGPFHPEQTQFPQSMVTSWPFPSLLQAWMPRAVYSWNPNGTCVSAINSHSINTGSTW